MSTKLNLCLHINKYMKQVTRKLSFVILICFLVAVWGNPGNAIVDAGWGGIC